MTRRGAPPSYVERVHAERCRSLKAQLALSHSADPNRPEDIRALLRLITETGLEQKSIAAALGTGQTTISRWMSGKHFPDTAYQRRQLLEDLRHILAQRLRSMKDADKDAEPARPIGKKRTIIRREPDPK